MPKIFDQATFRRHSRLDFCYLCGQPLGVDLPRNRDHCPPKSMFVVGDRENYPTALVVHEKCNTSWRDGDAMLGALYDLLHRKRAEGQRGLPPVKIATGNLGNSEVPLIVGTPLPPLVGRIVRFAHAVLYATPLFEPIQNSRHIPLPELDPDRPGHARKLAPQFPAFAEALCRAQKSGCFDAIRSYNGAFKWVSIWVESDDGQPFAIFAFDIYRMGELAYQLPGYPQCVIGSYIAPKPMQCATLATSDDIVALDELMYPILF